MCEPGFNRNKIIWVPFSFPTFIQLTHFASPSENKNHRENRSDALELSASHRSRLTDKRSKTSSALWELLALLLINRTPRVKQCKQQYKIKNKPHHWAHRLFQPCKHEQDSVLWLIQAHSSRHRWNVCTVKRGNYVSVSLKAFWEQVSDLRRSDTARLHSSASIKTNFSKLPAAALSSKHKKQNHDSEMFKYEISAVTNTSGAEMISWLVSWQKIIKLDWSKLKKSAEWKLCSAFSDISWKSD